MKSLGIDLEEIKRWLKRGDIKKIAKDEDVDPSYASRVLSGQFPNHAIISRALDKAIERKSAIMGKLERLKQI